ncbi:DNA methyltransferase [Thermococcus sp.]
MGVYSLIDVIEWITESKYSSKEVKLFNDAKQLYELQLAKMEFLNFSNNLNEFIKRTAYFEEILGNKCWHYYISSVKGKGQIGHTNQYMTHWFYPYKGKFHGQMIKALINFSNARGNDIVLDPYLGSGTTLIESSLLGLPGWGVEINPALAIVSQIKLDALGIDYPEFSKTLTPALTNGAFKYFKNLKVSKNSIKPTVEEHLNAKELLNLLWDSYFPHSILHDLPFEWRNILMLIYLHALSDYTYLKGTKKEKTLQEFYHRNLQDYLKTLKGAYSVINELGIKLGNYEVLIGSTLGLPYKNNSVKTIITSPPYSIALDYIKNDEHLLRYFGIDISALRDQMIGLKGKGKEKIYLYEQDLKRSVEEMLRVIKPGGWAVIVLGDISINGTRTNFKDKILSWGREFGCSEAFVLERAILGGFARLRFEYLIFLQK